MGLKIAVVGGGSTYTPELVDGLAQRAGVLRVDELVLHDIDRRRLDIVGGLAGRMFRRTGWPGVLTLSTDLHQAITGADFVLVQLRIGGQQARQVDETLPLAYGTLGQETTGAGGFAKGLRTIPVVLEIADLTRRIASPGAWIIDFTNPVGMVTQALLDAGHRAIGLCNVAITTQRSLAKRLGVAPERVRIEHVGLNHLSWIRAVWVDDVDRLPELLATQGEEIAREMDLPVEDLRRLGAIPSYYLRYYYAFDRVLARQRDGHSRADEVRDIEARLLDQYEDPQLDEKPPLLADRGGAYYSEAAVELIEALHADSGDVHVVNLRNEGALAELADDDVVELPARIHAGGPQPLPQRPLPAELRELILAVKRYERLAISAALTGDRRTALEALRANPLVGPRTDPAPLLDALLDANRQYLPQFATPGTGA